MQNPKLTADQVRDNLEVKLARYFGCTAAEATNDQMYKATAMTVRDILTEKRGAFKKKVNQTGSKRVYYMCMEFLLGRSLKNNLCNLGLDATYGKALEGMGFSLEKLYDCEPDAGLGNGGLGRLAACFMDSLSSLDYPATGFSLCYDYGLFRQMIVDGIQVELPDIWLPGGEVWLVPRTDRIYHVKMGGHVKENWKDGHLEISYENYDEVEAVPYDMMISGADSKAVSQLRLWRARDIHNFNMGLFTQGQYARAVEESTNAEIISKVLYPSDNHTEGKLLRLSQQYFMVSASCQSIIRDHMAVYGTLDNLADKVAIHINDTHPALCIPELMRILVDEYFYPWEKAWKTVVVVCSYTNHTVMPEALETWNEDLFRLKLPRIHSIIKEINERFCKDAWKAFPGNWNRISKMSLISYGQVHMANLCLATCQKVNGVSRLHGDILKNDLFHDLYTITPERFTYVTNGIDHRRWLSQINPGLDALVKELTGGKEANQSVNPDEVVAVGAAVQSGVIKGDRKDVLLIDVTPLSLGIETMGGINTKIIERNTTVPVKKSQIFSTAADNQPSVEVHVLQGEREFAKDNKTLGVFHLDGIMPAPRGVPQIEVTFDIDANGIVHVSAKDLGTQKEQSISITSSTNMSKEDIDKAVADAERYAQEDKQRREDVDTRNGADQMVYQCEKLINENGDKFSDEEKNAVNEKVEALKEALKGEDINLIKSRQDELQAKFYEISEKLYKAAAEAAQAQQGAAGADGSTDANGYTQADFTDADDNK